MQARTPTRPKFEEPLLTYECPRCGDAYDCDTEDDRFQVTVHRLLHMAGEWKRSLHMISYLATSEHGPSPVAD